MEKYLEGEELTKAEIKRGIRQATIDMKIFPALCGTAFKNKGIQTLLDAVVDYLPSPLDKPPVEGINPDNHSEILTRKPDDSEPLAALGFKIINDPFGKLCFIRVYSGTLKTGDTIRQSAHRQDRPRGPPGEDARQQARRHQRDSGWRYLRRGGLKELKTGDTLCPPNHQIALGAIIFPDTVISVAIEPKTKADQEKMGVALSRLADEDPTFKVRTDDESGQTIISGMGELHLEILVDRMKREHKVEANVGEPKVAFRETIRKKPRPRASTSARPAARATTAIASCASSPTSRARATSSSTPSSRARSPRNTSSPSIRACRAPSSWASWPAIRWWTSR
jgi:elongation factor G